MLRDEVLCHALIDYEFLRNACNYKCTLFSKSRAGQLTGSTG